MSPPKRTPHGKGLTVAADKVAVLLRLPGHLNARIEHLAKRKTWTRTAALYWLLETHPAMVAGKK